MATQRRIILSVEGVWLLPMPGIISSATGRGLSIFLPLAVVSLDSAMGLGDIGPVSVGKTWQREMNGLSGGDLDHNLYHCASGNIALVAANRRLRLAGGGDYHHTIGGEINRPDEVEGDFHIRKRSIWVSGALDISQGITSDIFYSRYGQTGEGDIGGEHIYIDDSGNWFIATGKKRF